MPRENITVRVWDLPIRLFHWSVVVLIVASWGTAKLHLMHWHKLSGYAVLTLLLVRLGWGFIGGSTARFSSFITGPKQVLLYARHFLGSAPGNFIGHNPMGALSVVALLLALVVQVATGLILTDTDFINSGPLSSLVPYNVSSAADRIHHISFTAIEILVALHVAVILFYALRKRENLVGAMITGRKQVPSDIVQKPLVFAPLWRAAALLIAAAGFVTWLVVYAVPKVPGL